MSANEPYIPYVTAKEAYKSLHGLRSFVFTCFSMYEREPCMSAEEPYMTYVAAKEVYKSLQGLRSCVVSWVSMYTEPYMSAKESTTRLDSIHIEPINRSMCVLLCPRLIHAPIIHPLFATEPYTSAHAFNLYAHEPYISANKPYISAKATCISAKETYISAWKTHISAKETCIPAKKPNVFQKTAWAIRQDMKFRNSDNENDEQKCFHGCLLRTHGRPSSSPPLYVDIIHVYTFVCMCIYM